MIVAASRSCWKTARTSSRCRSAPSLTDEEVARFTARSASAFRASRSRRGYSATISYGEGGQPFARLRRPHQAVREERTWTTGLMNVCCFPLSRAAPALVPVGRAVRRHARLWHLCAQLPRARRRLARRAAPPTAWLLLAVGPAVALAEHTFLPGIFSLFLLAAYLWAYWHLVRQHWGFVALYQRGAPTRLGWLLWLGCVYPLARFSALANLRAKRHAGAGSRRLRCRQRELAVDLIALGLARHHRRSSRARPSPALAGTRPPLCHY